MNKQDLEERLIDFAAKIILFTNQIEKSYAGNHLLGQITRSSTSPALNYGEAQSAESKRDFIHKMGICLKELRETLNCLKIIERAKLTSNSNELIGAKAEANELISIFVSSIKTAKSNNEKNKTEERENSRIIDLSQAIATFLKSKIVNLQSTIK